MNILKRELRAGFKPFLFWALGLFALIFAGITKYTGIGSGGGSVNIAELLGKFPKVVLAVMGMAGVDISTLGGYYFVLAYYLLICAAIYAVYLGSNAVSRETFDKTYEFLFTKPRSRSFILWMKLLAAWIFLAVFCILIYFFSISAIAALGFSENLHVPIFLFSISVFLVGSVFFTLSAFFSAAARQAEKGTLYGNCCFLFAFVLGIIYDMLENGGALKFLSPLKYFNPADLLQKDLDPLFAAICIVLTAIFLRGALERFRRKDLTAV